MGHFAHIGVKLFNDGIKVAPLTTLAVTGVVILGCAIYENCK